MFSKRQLTLLYSIVLLSQARPICTIDQVVSNVDHKQPTNTDQDVPRRVTFSPKSFDSKLAISESETLHGSDTHVSEHGHKRRATPYISLRKYGTSLPSIGEVLETLETDPRIVFAHEEENTWTSQDEDDDDDNAWMSLLEENNDDNDTDGTDDTDGTADSSTISRVLSWIKKWFDC